MIIYVLCCLGRALRETLTLSTAPPPVMIDDSHYLVRVNGTVHRVRRDRVCSCGGTVAAPCAAFPLIQDYLAAGGPRPIGRHEDTWPESWTTIPAVCPVCECPTGPDRYLDSSHGPGWRCSLDPSHYWMVRTNPLKRYLAANPLPPRYPWYEMSEEERQTWLDEHYAPPRLRSPSPLCCGDCHTAPQAVASSNEGDNHHALDRTPPGKVSAIRMPPYA